MGPRGWREKAKALVAANAKPALLG